MGKRREVSNEEFVTALNDPTCKKIMCEALRSYKLIIPTEDLKACSMDALWKCLGYHIDGMGKKFTTNLWTFIDFECRRQLKKIARSKRLPTVPISTIEAKNKKFDIANPIKKSINTKLRDSIELLPNEDKTLLEEYYVDNYTMAEIGDKHGCSKESIRNKLKKAISHLRHLYKVGV